MRRSSLLLVASFDSVLGIRLRQRSVVRRIEMIESVYHNLLQERGDSTSLRGMLELDS
jgi:hypothetical protein